MRNPDRIEPFMNELAQLWKNSAPDMRFGQFISNALGEMASRHGDPFFWEENKFMEYIKEVPWIKEEV